jgi:hypothetical protein
MKRRQLYETPDAELLVIQHEENFLQQTGFNGDNNEDPYDDGEENL